MLNRTMLVIGNGESRLTVDINALDTVKIGCNAIFRDYEVEHIVCVDRRVCEEALESKINDTSLIYTRQEHFKPYTKRLREVPPLPHVGYERFDLPEHWGSGPYAVLLGATKSQEVHLLGFDLYSKDEKVNNVYKGTKNYIAAEKSAVDPRYWIYQIGKVFEYYSNTTFTIYQEDGWARPKAWKKPNVKVDNISNIYYNT